MTFPIITQVWQAERFQQFAKFCVVGTSGLFVDMGVLFLLADPKCLGLNVSLSKVCSAESALISNFIWNELWTFRSPFPLAGPKRVKPLNPKGSPFNHGRVLRRFVLFNAICGIGIGFSVLLLHLFHDTLGWNLYFANLLAIIVVTFWNFVMNARFNWNRGPVECSLNH